MFMPYAAFYGMRYTLEIRSLIPRWNVGGSTEHLSVFTVLSRGLLKKTALTHPCCQHVTRRKCANGSRVSLFYLRNWRRYPLRQISVKNVILPVFRSLSIPSTGRKRVRFAWQIALICDGLYTAQVNARLTNFLEKLVYGASGSN